MMIVICCRLLYVCLNKTTQILVSEGMKSRGENVNIGVRAVAMEDFDKLYLNKLSDATNYSSETDDNLYLNLRKYEILWSVDHTTLFAA